MKSDHNEQGGIECDQGMSELKQAGAARSCNKFRRRQKVGMNQPRMNRKGKDEDKGKDNEAQS